MRAIDQLLLDFDRESGVTRVLLERVPEDRIAWRPHPRSTSLGDLALHLASLPGWVKVTLRQAEFDINPPEGMQSPPSWVSREALLATFDANVASARAALAAAMDGELQAPWTLKSCGHPLFTVPRGTALRTWAFNHAIHHRGQLSVYLRLCDVPVPAMYGPSADVPLSL
jgi:uncharacterized damage-inducible protein DinB